VLIPIIELIKDFNAKPTKILHVGAHLAEESAEYNKYFNVPVIWIEAQPKLCLELRKKLNPKNNTVIEACVYDKDNEILNFNISSNSQSSSVLEFGTHADAYPDIIVNEIVTVNTKRLDTILHGQEIPDFINLDIQGVELKAIKGLGHLINKVQMIYTEVNKRHVYDGCDLVKDIDSYLKLYGFKRISTRWWFMDGWGDALYVNPNVPPRTLLQIIRGRLRLLKYYCFKTNIIKKLVKSM